MSRDKRTLAMPLQLFSANGTTAILDAKGNEVVGWMGFDDSRRTDAEHRDLAARLVQCVNAHDELVAALRVALAALDCDVSTAPMDATTARLSQNWMRAKFGAKARAAIDKIEGAPIQPPEPHYYLQDARTYVGNCPLWWAQDGKGYTTDVRQAHRYTQAEAMQQHECRDTDRPWPCADIDKLVRHTIDMQDMRRIKPHPMDACRHGNRKSDCDHCKETL